MKSIGLYIHIPFCASKCRYCDFLSFENCGSDLQKEYTWALKEEIRKCGELYRNKIIVNTIFIGGGTPSLLEPRLITQIMAEIIKSFRLTEDIEITIEANPGTLSEEKLSAYRKVGINRLSMGVQALNDNCLRGLGRIHTVSDFTENYNMARQVGFDNINMDLMFAIPGHTMKLWEETISRAITFGTEHISFYSLQLEEGTL